MALLQPPRLHVSQVRLKDVASRLQRAHRGDESELGNQPDPLDEAVYIILSFQTDVPRLRLTWSNLRQAYPDWGSALTSGVTGLEHVLKPAGLHRQKATTIVRLLESVRDLTGSLSLECLRAMRDEDAEHFLLRLPGLGWKGARCVLLYSLDRKVLPVDTNTFRILKRNAIIPIDTVYRKKTVHDAIQAAVNHRARRRTHVNFVLHGRRVCLPRGPLCDRCVLSRLCPKAGVSREA